MAKSLFEVFNEDFVREIREARRYPEALYKASEKFEKQHGFEPFPSYEAFQKKRYRSRKRK
jgi:hypothetical protein